MKCCIQTDTLQAILAVADKHPNSKISKLIKNVELEKTSKNIVLLFMELADHPAFAYDHSISLQYYLHMFQELPEDTSFPDTGLLLLNSAIIYGKRVDDIHISIEKLIISLIKNDNFQDNKLDDHISIPKRGRKRPLEELNEPYEANMQAKRFKTISSSKRFDSAISCRSGRSDDYVEKFNKNYNHPAIWKHSTIEDFDYDDDSDTKKNYKLFTYHLEHRYNTLIPDVNFKMYYKMKDFIDIQCRDSLNSELWPPLSDAYIEQYVNIENQILNNELQKTSITFSAKEQEQKNHNNGSSTDCHLSVNKNACNMEECFNSDQQKVEQNRNDNGKAISRNRIILENTSLNCDSTYDNQYKLDTDSGVDLGSSISTELNETCPTSDGNTIHLNEICSIRETDGNDTMRTEVNINDQISIKEPNKTEEAGMALSPCDLQSDVDFSSIKVILPHLDDEGVFFSDLDERDHQMLSPAVVATDVFRCMKDKNNVIVIVDDEIKKMYNILEPREHVLTLPVDTKRELPKLTYNLLKVHPKYLKKRRTFKLGPEFHLLKKARQKKLERGLKTLSQPRTWVRLSEDVIGVPLSPTPTEDGESEFYGFPEEISNDKNRSLSRDSGISVQHTDSLLERHIGDDFLEDTITIQRSSDSGDICEAINQTNQTDNTKSLENEDSISIMTSTMFSKAENNEMSEVQANTTASIEKHYDDEKCFTNKKDKTNETNEEIEKTEMLKSTMTKVQEWHAHLQPILAQSRNRHHFDVFELGSEIINQFGRCDDNSNVVTLNHVMENKPTSLISRYFLSTLLLANQGNIGIKVNNGNSEAPSELCDVHLRLLCKKRHVVTLDDNADLNPPTLALLRPFQEPILSKVRTLKPVPSAPKCEDHDSGVSLSSI